MKNTILTFLMFSMTLSLFSQTEEAAAVYYEMNTLQKRTISQGDLKAVSTISDIDERYPADWVKEYVSVEIKAICNGVPKSAMGENGTLNEAQKALLVKADSDTDVEVDVKYIPDNNLKHNDVQTYDFSMHVLPENNAEFPGGEKKMLQYLEREIKNKIPASIPVKEINWSAVRFTVDADGSINNINVRGSSSFEELDKIIKDAICGMPLWTAAKDTNSKNVAQDFEFVLGNTAKICGLNYYFGHDQFLE